MSMSKHTDVLVVGELNVDLILNDLASFPVIGKEIRAGAMTYTLGSSSAIFASNLASLGTKVALKGKVGQDDFGDKVVEEFNKSGVDTRLIIRDNQVKTGITVVLNERDDRAMVTYPGAMEHLTVDEITDEDFEDVDHLHISSIFLQPGIQQDLLRLLRRAKEHGLSTSLDPQWDPDEKWDLDLSQLAEPLDIFLPNEQELAHFAGSKSTEEFAHSLSQKCIVVVKQSRKGATLYYNGGDLAADAFLNDNPVDAIGAGDSFDAGFIYRYVQGEPLHVCLEFANIVGAVSTTAAGGTSAIQSLDQVLQTAKEQFGSQ